MRSFNMPARLPLTNTRTGLFAKRARRKWRQGEKWVRMAFAAIFIVSLLLIIRSDRILRTASFKNGADIDVLGVAVKPSCVSKEAVKSLNQYFGPRRIIVITTSEQSCKTFESFADNVQCHVENTIMPGVSKDSVAAYLENRYGVEGKKEFKGRHLAGWYLQQFLKMGVAKYVTDLSEHYVVWDMDMILLRELKVLVPTETRDGNAFDGQMKTLVNIGGSRNSGYDYSYKALTGRDLEYAPDGSSFVTHWLVVYKPYMVEFLDSIEPPSNSTEVRELKSGDSLIDIEGSPGWVWNILDSLHKEHIHIGFSEYASYVSWVKQNYPESQHVMKKQTWIRHPFGGEGGVSIARFFNRNGLCCPVGVLLESMRLLGYQYMGFEIGHSDTCKYNDPKYVHGYGVEG